MIYVNYKKNKIIITCIIVKFINKIAKFFGLRGINNFIIRKSKKFDVYFYNQTYADVKINNIDPIDHYLSTGESLGNLLFTGAFKTFSKSINSFCFGICFIYPIEFMRPKNIIRKDVNFNLINFDCLNLSTFD